MLFRVKREVLEKARGPYRQYRTRLIMLYASSKIENNAQPVTITRVDEDLAEHFYNVAGEYYTIATPSEVH